MQNILIELVERFGYLGVAFLICIENVFPPIPSEVILLFGGVMTTRSSMNPWGMILSATIGATIGAVILYEIGYHIKRDRLKRILEGKIGRRLHLKPEDVDKADACFKRYGYVTVFICRCVPILRSLISIPAGISEMRFFPFLFLTVIGSTIWNTILVWSGVFAGNAWESVLQYVDSYSNLILAILAGASIIIIFFWYKRKNREKVKIENSKDKK